jgi:sulfhydrogenase subunit beta (sulfur reductase)
MAGLETMSDIAWLPRTRFPHLLEILRASGYRCIGPQVRDGTIVYDAIETVDQFPAGVRDIQRPGAYRLERTGGPRWFAWADGPQALKPLTFSPRETLWRAEHTEDGTVRFRESQPPVQPLAVIGVRACDLAALALQDKHFLGGAFRDPYFQARRENLFLIAADCMDPAETCFCASTGDGPGAESGFDIALSELDEGFIVRAGSARGQDILSKLPLEHATQDQVLTAQDSIRKAAEIQVRGFPSRNLRQVLFSNLGHPRWNDVAARCLSCGNCTSVCPTCFCHSEGEQPSLDGRRTEHTREWDSCFTAGHSYFAGVVVRSDTRLRYRQWLTHKLGSWHDQYGRSGCVGCGRCITWCPVGIDITREAAAVYAGAEHA